MTRPHLTPKELARAEELANRIFNPDREREVVRAQIREQIVREIRDMIGENLDRYSDPLDYGILIGMERAIRIVEGDQS